MTTTVRFVVSGLVQGVGYRAFARRAALRLGLMGFAENLPDGRVEAVVVGPVEAIERFAAELARGPSFGQVTSVIRVEISDQIDLPNSFEIR